MKDKHTYGEKMAGNGRKKVIYKGTFVSKQSLELENENRGSQDSTNLVLPGNHTIAKIVLK